MIYQDREIRHELKYMINNIEYKNISSRIKENMIKDKNTNEIGEYHIRSLYFDDINNSSYNQKESGVLQRRKYRIRIYNKSDQRILLEKKEKFDMYISKTSRVISKKLYYDILNNKLNLNDVKNDKLLLDFYTEVKINSLKPVVIVDYIREPYIFNIGNVRITFDKNLQAVINSYDIFDKSSLVLTPNLYGSMILEVKYDDYLPEFIRRELKMSQHQHLAISKYTICRDLRNNLDWSERSL